MARWSAVGKIRRQVPVEDYLRLQKRFAHLFREGAEDRTRIDAIQRMADANIRRYGLTERGAGMTGKPLPYAITLDPGSSLHNHTGSWRTERPVYVDKLPPCNNACPAGENIQNWLFHAEGGDYAAAWQALIRDNPMPAVMGRVCYHTCETACNRAQLDEAVGIHAVERFLGITRSAKG